MLRAPRLTSSGARRHAVTAQTGPLLSGRAPGIDLSEKGREQADALGERLADLPVAVVYASPIERTMQTADAVAGHHGLDVLTAPRRDRSRLRRLDWRQALRAGEDRPLEDGAARAVASAVPRRRVAGRDADCAWCRRSKRVVADHPGELVVVVSHADPIKAAIAHYTGVHLDLFQRIVVSPASVTVFELSAHGAAMVKCNDTGSLDELRPPEPTPEAADGRRRRRRYRRRGSNTEESAARWLRSSSSKTSTRSAPARWVSRGNARSTSRPAPRARSSPCSWRRSRSRCSPREAVAFLDRIADEYPRAADRGAARETAVCRSRPCRCSGLG